MAEAIPFAPGVPIQRLEVTLNSQPMIIDARWNSRDAAYYLDVFDIDEKPIARSLKVVLGAKLGRQYTHPFFQDGALVVVDRANTFPARECGLDDLGDRIAVLYLTNNDIELMLAPPFKLPELA